VNPAPTKVTKHALQEHGAFHDFYGVAGDADGVDADGGFAGADEEFAGAAGFDALAEQDLLMGRPKFENGKEKLVGWGGVKVPTLWKARVGHPGWGTRREATKQQIPRSARNDRFAVGRRVLVPPDWVGTPLRRRGREIPSLRGPTRSGTSAKEKGVGPLRSG
jgi:hypothetical protein